MRLSAFQQVFKCFYAHIEIVVNFVHVCSLKNGL